MPHPKVVLVGSTASGKSTLVSSISGIMIGTVTTCPIEWNICRSETDTWSAEVSVAYYYRPLFGSKRLLVHGATSLSENGPCSTPIQLLYLLRRAQIVAFSPCQDSVAILSMDDDTVARNYSKILLSSSPSKGVIYVDLLVPGFTSHGITIIDLPGLRQAGYSDIIDHGNSISRYYAAQEGVIVAVVTRITEPKRTARALSLIAEKGQGSTVILTHARSNLAHTSWLKILAGAMNQPYNCLCFHLPDAQSQFAFTVPDQLRLRQDEAAYFLFSEPWRSLPSHTAGKMGIANILREWDHAWKLRDIKRTPRPLTGWKGICVGVLVALLIYFATQK